MVIDLSRYYEKIVSFFSANSPKILETLILLILGYVIIKVLIFIIHLFLDKIKINKSLQTFLQNITKVVLWLFFTLFIISNLGFNITGFLAGLGIAGIIVGFALQDTLGNLAAGVFILFQQPFKVDDFIKVSGVVGGVERIGIAACVLRSRDNVKITIPNSKIWKDVIENYSGNPIRQLFNLDVCISYDSDLDKAIKIITNILKKDKRVLENPEPQVVVKNLEESAVKIAVRPSVKTEKFWDVYFDTIKKIKEEFDKNNIKIPFPQREVWMKQSTARGKIKKK